MILFLAPCVLALSAGPLTPAAAVQRRNLALADAVRVTLIDGTLTPRTAQLVQVEASTDANGRTTGTVVVIDERGSRMATPISGPEGEILALAPSWWIVDDSTAMLQPAPRQGAMPSLPASSIPGGTGADATAGATLIHLTDGQRFTGQLAQRDSAAGTAAARGRGEDSVRWSHPLLGPLLIPIDSVKSLSLRADPGTSPPGSGGAQADQDSVLLVNGDRVPGYVDAIIGPPDGGVTITRAGAAGSREGAGAGSTIALEQVASVTLANRPESPQGLVVWLGDSSVAAARRFDVDAANGRMTLAVRVPGMGDGAAASAQSGAVSSLDLADLRAAAFDAGRIVPLSSLPVASVSPRSGRRLTEHPRSRTVTPGWPSPLGADDIELPGPLASEWVLPPRSIRIAGWVALDPAAAVWGDCEVVFELVEGTADNPNSRELARQRINSSSPVMAINAVLLAPPDPSLAPRPAPAAKRSRLRITVDSGHRGPIQDRVVLRRMCVLTEAPPRPPAPASGSPDRAGPGSGLR